MYVITMIEGEYESISKKVYLSDIEIGITHDSNIISLVERSPQDGSYGICIGKVKLEQADKSYNDAMDRLLNTMLKTKGEAVRLTNKRGLDGLTAREFTDIFKRMLDNEFGWK